MSIYLKDGQTGKVLLARNASQPRMTNHAGASWDWLAQNIDLGGVECEIHYDSTWGRYGYFERDGSWYKVSLGNDEETFPLFEARNTRREYPTNFDILRRRDALDVVPKAEYDEFKDTVRCVNREDDDGGRSDSQ